MDKENGSVWQTMCLSARKFPVCPGLRAGQSSVNAAENTRRHEAKFRYGQPLKTFETSWEIRFETSFRTAIKSISHFLPNEHRTVAKHRRRCAFQIWTKSLNFCPFANRLSCGAFYRVKFTLRGSVHSSGQCTQEGSATKSDVRTAISKL